MPSNVLLWFLFLLALRPSGADDKMDKRAEENKRAYAEMLEKKEAKKAEEAAVAEDGENKALDDDFNPEMLGLLHDKMDANKDGHVSIEEVASFNKHIDSEMADGDVASIMKDFDKNGDGKLTIDEYITDEGLDGIHELNEEMDPVEGNEDTMAEHMDMQKKMFQAADDDNDGVLTLKEFKGLIHPETNLKVLRETVVMVMKDKDTDKDGYLSLKEFFMHPSDPEAGDVEPHPEEQKNFDWLDKDKDGQLDIEETMRWESGEINLYRSWEDLFGHTDKDKDGHITKKEFVDAHPEIVQGEAHQMMKFWNEHLEL